MQLSTLHAAKGLEFGHVFLVGCEESILPNFGDQADRELTDERLEEERRLMYVGITRAQRTLAMTYASKRKQFGELIDCTPSRFLDELPDDDVTWVGGEGASSTPEDKEKNKNAISDLRALLNS